MKGWVLHIAKLDNRISEFMGRCGERPEAPAVSRDSVKLKGSGLRSRALGSRVWCSSVLAKRQTLKSFGRSKHPMYIKLTFETKLARRDLSFTEIMDFSIELSEVWLKRSSSCSDRRGEHKVEGGLFKKWLLNLRICAIWTQEYNTLRLEKTC